MKRILVTGASFGIGKSICESLAKEGHTVIAVARSLEELKKLSMSYSNILSYSLDITNLESLDILAKEIGKVDVVVHNAGGGGTNKSLLNDHIESWEYSYKINVLAPVYITKAFLPEMIKNKSGHFIFITSTCGHFVYKNGSGYTVSKHAEVALSELLRMELVGTGVRVTEIAPGNVNSRGNGDPASSLTPEDVAEAVRWSASMPSHVNIDSIKLLHVNNSIR
jgi:NADP-dependent 3-hydroxy acid dehydrogenase YdfG